VITGGVLTNDERLNHLAARGIILKVFYQGGGKFDFCTGHFSRVLYLWAGAVSGGLTASSPTLNKIGFPGSIGTVADKFGRSATNLCKSEALPINTGSVPTAA